VAPATAITSPNRIKPLFSSKHSTTVAKKAISRTLQTIHEIQPDVQPNGADARYSSRCGNDTSGVPGLMPKAANIKPTMCKNTLDQASTVNGTVENIRDTTKSSILYPDGQSIVKSRGTFDTRSMLAQNSQW